MTYVDDGRALKTNNFKEVKRMRVCVLILWVYVCVLSDQSSASDHSSDS